MSDSHYNYYDPEFDPKGDDDNDLLIMITETAFSFAVIQKYSNKVLVWGEGYDHTELDEPAELDGVLTSNYKEVKIGVQSTSFTIVHKNLYKEEHITDYSKFLDPRPGEVALVNLLDDDNYVVFKISEPLANAVSKHFNLKSVFFAGKAWIAAVNVAKPYIQPLYMHVDGDMLQMYHAQDDKLDFYNCFKFNNPDELMYYTVLTANELNINLDATSVILSGEITVSDRKIQRVSDLLPKVYFNQNQIVALPSGFISHQILILAGLTLCESLGAN